MSSEPDEAFVWVWLPGTTSPLVAGRLEAVGAVTTFTYGRSYLGRRDAVSLYLPELPLRSGRIFPDVGEVAGCISDAAPDAWGQRVILNARAGSGESGPTDPGILTYLLESGSDRIGALDFQRSATDYVSRSNDRTALAELARAAECVERGIPLSPALGQALLHGSSVGGARPKVLLRDDDRHLIAKFSSTTDSSPVVTGEYVAMELARRAGINAAKVELTKALGEDVLLIHRFDRTATGGRQAMVSAHTILGLSGLSPIGSYARLADQIRARFSDPVRSVHELFARITFNILTGNTDDHARNHSAFWDGSTLALTPAYDICPQPRSGGEAAQVMEIGIDGYRMSQLAGCVARASTYLLSETEARGIIDHQIEVIEGEWADVCDAAELSPMERSRYWHRQFLNPYALQDY
jgi:serine/threonine-protein kinase HipA